MKKSLLITITILLTISLATWLILKNTGTIESENLTITYPYNNAVFPADITAPTITWQDSTSKRNQWEVSVSVPGLGTIKNTKKRSTRWCPTPKEWDKMVEQALDNKMTITVKTTKQPVLTDSIQIFISEDKVEAPIFFRAVPLPFKFARENLKKVRWHIGSVSNETKPHTVLENIPVCANCHSFTPDGNTIAMDVDARDDKGAYAISALNEEILFAEDSLIHWSDFNKGKFTYGLLSRISPNGRYVVSTLRDCEIFVDRPDLEYSQLFFPFKGILAVYDRLTKEYFELEGANDTMLVQSNPCWSPDGEFIYFTRAKAKHYEKSGIHNGSIPKPVDLPRYEKFEKSYTDRDSLIKFDIYKVPFNKGKGGKATPVPGASHNGKSNYFPKISPDGKWLVYCQAESFMLLQKDSRLFILPAEGGEPREMTCNTNNMNSWHSWSPNSKWLVFATKAINPYTQLFLTHINEDGTDSPPVHLEKFSFDKHANNIPEFINAEYNPDTKINPTFLSENDFLIRAGEIKEKEGDLDGAFEAYNEAVELFPEESEPYYKRGLVYFMKNNFRLALEDFSKAIQIKERTEYYTSRGLVCLKMGIIDNTIEDLSMASRLAPSAYTPLAYLGVAHVRKNNFNDAIECLDKAVAIYNEDPLTWYYLGYAAFKTSNWEKADNALTNALKFKLSIQNRPVFEMRGKARFYTGKFQGAIDDLQKAVQIKPTNGELWYLLGKAQMEAGKRNEARKNLEKADQLGFAEGKN